MTTRLAFALSLAVALTACGPGGKPPAGAAPAAPQVSVLTLQTQQVALTSRLTGRTASFRVADIRPQVSGLIQKRLFTEGSEVAAGQVLYQIDPATFKAALDSAAANLARVEASRIPAKARAERFKTLLDGQMVSQQEYDDAAAALAQVEADIAAWKAQVELARINLGYTAITAPISGRIGRSAVTEGATVTAYQPQALASIHQLDPIFVDVPQSTSDLLRIRRSLESGRLRREEVESSGVGLILDDGSRYPLPGQLRFRDAVVDPASGSVVVRILFPNPQGLLLPEMFVRVDITEGVADRALLVPQQAVMRNPKGEPYVYVVDGEGRVAMRAITVVREIDGQWLVTKGLAAGEQVAMTGLQTLQMARPGAELTVKAVPFAAAPAATAATAAPAPAAPVATAAGGR